MIVKEYRIVLPITVEEYQMAQLWSVAQASKNETGGGEGIEVIANEPTEDKGQYTKKFYRFGSRVPRFVAFFMPKGSMDFLEEAWNAYPYCKTVFTNPGYMKDNFEIVIQSLHLPDLGTTENAHGLPKEEWESVKKNGIVNINIAAPVKSSDYQKEYDPALFKSEKGGRGPLKIDWLDELKAKVSNGQSNCSEKPQYMCAYKLVSCKFKWRGLQNRVENLIHSQEVRLFTNFHRQVFCWMDNWYGLTMDDIRRIEDETQRELDEMRSKGEIRGMKVEDS